MEALAAGTLQANDVVVIRWEGPKGGPGMREMLAITGAIKGAGLGKDVLLLTDGRFSGGTTGCASGTSRPRPRTAARSRSSRTATGSGSTSPPARWTCSWTTPSSSGAARMEAAPAAHRLRRPGQVRQARRLRRVRRGLRLTRLLTRDGRCAAVRSWPSRVTSGGREPRAGAPLSAFRGATATRRADNSLGVSGRSRRRRARRCPRAAALRHVAATHCANASGLRDCSSTRPGP